jgi:methyltransferase family protein
MAPDRSAVRVLSDAQTASFDTDFVDVGKRWPLIRDRIRDHWGAAPFTFLDVGGGNGAFADRLLEEFPAAHGTVLEPSALLLERNSSHPRKALVQATAAVLPAGPFDLICVHWLLHHLVGSSYAATRREQIATLRGLRERLTPNGRISCYENMYQGRVIDDLPGRLIFQATALRILAPLTRRLGANTAGVGVCFHAESGWRTLFTRAGLRVVGYVEPDWWPWPIRRLWRLGLHLAAIRTGHAWLART